MGRITVRTLLEYEDVDQVTIADYNEARAHEVAERYMKQTCKGRPYEEILAGLEGDVNYRTLFRCR